MIEVLKIPVMPTPEKTVMLQVEVKESIRTRLRVQAVQRGLTMGELAEQILDQALKKLEKEGV
ncbi:hypothetical protein Cri9333_4943 (plasmid) [Crinalium epipsammum PCC 9333]|uniref:CopG-like ribbon-helix-helix domain-containing protein n=1 Tax=Crinalium epipsammum PCC 9333 TaxID=1173022 RepID=K9W7C6_9CYAN|nr:hypothetical protein [Crinalium epipsammum]AFZ15699.1 hypothetical protein Cri9333_4943 [Crinalium epipsammum PCC 9333]